MRHRPGQARTAAAVLTSAFHLTGVTVLETPRMHPNLPLPPHLVTPSIQLRVFIPGGSIGRSTRPQSAMDGASPGPGAYTVVVNSFLPSSPKQPIGKSPRAMSAKAEGSPGPSDYDSIHALSYVRPQSARATIGRATREQLSPSNVSAEVPLYAPTFDQFVPASPRQPIGRAERWQARPEDATPGAGAYTQPPSPKGPAYTMRAR